MEILISGGLLYCLVHIITTIPNNVGQDTTFELVSKTGTTHYFACSGHNFHLDFFVVAFCIAILILLILTAFGACLWGAIGLGCLSKVMKLPEVKTMFSRVKHEHVDEHEISLDIEELYYQNK